MRCRAENLRVIKHIVPLVLFVLLIPIGARAAAHVELSESVASIEQHDKTIVAVPLHGSAKPGQRLRYTIVAKNNGDRAALKLMPAQKIAGGLRFLEATPRATAEFSVDGGKTFAREPTIVVTTPGAAPATRRALPSEFTAVRWPVGTPLAPGSSMTFSLDVVVE